MTDSTHKAAWEQSYARQENYIFYPKEEVVKFLNRFVRKRTGYSSFADKLDFGQTVRGLDLGCGIGRQTILMAEFGLEAYGVDLSENAVAEAQTLAQRMGYPAPHTHFQAIAGDGPLPFGDNYFDIAISDCVLDSMPFELAVRALSEMHRTTKGLAFISLISGDDHTHHPEFAADEVVEEAHEKGTIQSYYNWTRVLELTRQAGYTVHWARIVHETGLTQRFRYGRYYLVLRK